MSITVMESWIGGWLTGHAEHAPLRRVVEVVTVRGLPAHDTSSPGPSTDTDTCGAPGASTDTGTTGDPGASGQAGSMDPCVAELVRIGRERALLDAALVRAVTQIVAVCRAGVLAHHGWEGTDLSPSQGRTLARDTKRRAVTETQTALGVRTREATTLVALAMGPAPVRDTVLGALERGESTWAQARRFWDQTTSPTHDLTTDQQTLVAHALHGTDPTLAAPERLDPDGTLTPGTPWAQAPYEAALTREITACAGTDTTTERERRHRAYQARNAHVRVHDNGTATLTLTGPITKILAAHTRHDTIARTLRAHGHPDTLAQLATDSMLTTLTHGTLHLPRTDRPQDQPDQPDRPDGPDQPHTPGGSDGPDGPDGSDALDGSDGLDGLDDEHLDDLIAVVNGHPRIALHVIVPADALGIGHPICATCATNLHPDEHHHTDHDHQDQRPRARTTTSSSTNDPDDPNDPDDDDPHDGPVLPFDRDGDPPPWARPPHPPLPPPAPGDLRRGRGQVAEIIGTHPGFITPGHTRELFYTPGTTLHRILTDPADGRAIERTITTYRPDTDMRRQVHTADLYSRNPQHRLTGRTLEIDHVIPYGTPGGTTTETNLADLDKRTHKIKTLRELTITINTRRDLTFTTLLGQITRSRTHDYTQYLHTTHPEDLEDRLDLANQTLYAALAHHPEHQRPPTTSDTWLTLDHTDPTTGQRHPGPPENHPHPHTLLGIPHPTYATDENDGTRLGEGTHDETAHDGDATPGTDASRPDAVD